MDIEFINDIERMTRSAKSVGAGFAGLLDRLLVARSECDLALLRRLDISVDAARLDSWFRALVAAEPPAADIARIHFGLAEMRPTGTNDRRWTLYACGYVAGREIGPGPDWWPAGRYADSSVLSAVSERLAAWPDDARLDTEYALVLGYALLIARMLAAADLVHGVAVSAGFDDGDFFRVNRYL